MKRDLFVSMLLELSRDVLSWTEKEFASRTKKKELRFRKYQRIELNENTLKTHDIKITLESE